MENTQNTPKRSGGKISYTLQAIGLIPLLALGIVMLFFTSQWFTKTMYQEVERELYDATKSATTLLNAAYPGDYRLEGDVAYLLYKGDVDITREYSLFDQFKEDTGLHVNVAENPLTSVATGLAKIIKDDNYKTVAYAIEGMSK